MSRRTTLARSSVLACYFLAAALSAGTAGAQGLEEYCNFESPQVKPIAIAAVTSLTTRHYIVACNTPDNTIEVFDVTGALRDAPLAVARIPVGLEPVSVAYKRITIGSVTKNMLYSVNWLGDSVTFVELSLNLGQALQYKITREVRVTDPRGEHAQGVMRGDDEAMHLAVVDRPGGAGQFLVVTKRTASSYSVLHPFTGEFLSARNNDGDTVLGGGRNVIMTSAGEGQNSLGQSVFGEGLATGALFALKEPHTVAWRPDTDQFWVLGHKGGGSTQPEAFGFDFDLWGIDSNPASSLNAYFHVGEIATTNFNMAFDATGSFLYVVGTEAQDQITGNGNLLSVDETRTGFATTVLYRRNMATGEVTKRDLNMGFGGFSQQGARYPGATSSLAHATDVAIYTDPDSGNTYACVAAFNSSRFGMIHVDAADPKTWSIARANVEPDPASSEAGPRGLAILSTGTAANDRAYLLNRLEPSISVIALNGGAPVFASQFDLQRSEVEPAYIREGRKFLYSTEFSGAGDPTQHGLEGFASCASCHVDGRSDNVSWRLTSLAHEPAPLVSSVMSPRPYAENDAIEVQDPMETDVLVGGFPSDIVEDNPPLDANAKGPMFTQSLQGLSNFEVGGSRIVTGEEVTSTGIFADEGDAALGDSGPDDDATGNPFDDLISNAPFHWRGDKESFRHFNEAFVNLMGMDPAPGATPGGGLTTAQMKAFERFINSIHYPPNPLQPENRRYSGAMWTDPSALTSGATDALLGLQFFHVRPLGSGNRSCGQCHNGSEGSNNRVTEVNGADAAMSPQPIETAGLRGLVQKNAILQLSSGPPQMVGTDPIEEGIKTGDFGFGHTGTNAKVKSLNGFIRTSFGINLPAREAGVTELMRQFDTGVAPIVGLSYSVTVDPNGSGAVWDRIGEIETQAGEANCGIAVYARVKVGATWVARGFWFDVTAGMYKEAGGSPIPRSDMLALLLPDQPDDLMVFRATPLGSERRIASFALSSPDLPTGSLAVPSDIEIVGTIPNTANQPVVDPVVGLSKNWDTTVDFNWIGPGSVPLSLRVLLGFQAPLGVTVPGTNHKRHDPPRRLQVTGEGLRPGAMLRITLPNVPNPTGPAFRNLELPLHPTTKMHAGRRVWETAVEFDARALYTMMLGGPGNASVDYALRGGTWLFQPSPAPKLIRVQAANLPHTTWSDEELVDFVYPAVY
jgi:hypothetical protein